jgi:hypothetical protein
MLDVFFDNIYYRLLIASILALILTFPDELHILKNPGMLVMIGILTVSLVMFDVVDDIGITILMMCLFVVVYNIQTLQRR